MNELIILVLLEIVYLVVGLFLCILGKNLLFKKLETSFEASATVAENTYKIVTRSPGLVFLTLGVAVIIVTIIKQVEIVDKYSNLTAEGNGQSTPNRIDYSGYTKETSIRFIEGINYEINLNEEIEIARSLAQDQKYDESAEHLAGIITLKPFLLKSLYSDKNLKKVFDQNIYLFNIVKNRYELKQSIDSNNVRPILAGAENLLKGLKSLSNYYPDDSFDTLKANRIIDMIPVFSGVEEKDTTIKKLKALIDISPQRAYYIIQDEKYNWILEDSKIVFEVERYVSYKETTE